MTSPSPTFVRVQVGTDPDDVFTDEAVANMVGQTPDYLGRPAEIVAASLAGPALVDLVLAVPGPVTS